ncbi:protein THEM6 isoform X1 [Pleurodeles waltl]|uniref:protein THEM6 isoform X1 n=1 Tax=Pleurodeles waltl TaxID=8319 RepID=UPI00370969E6
MDAELSQWLSVGLCLTSCFFAFIDGWYWLRVPTAVLAARLKPAMEDLLAVHTVKGWVMPSDLDFMFHMNNGRYLREADFARFSYLTRCGILKALRALCADLVMASCVARFRRSLHLFEPFQLSTRLLCWDERAFFMEQRFVSPKDGRVCAVLLSRLHVLRCSPDKVLQHILKKEVESPEFPDEVVHLISFNDASSKRLRVESGICDDEKSK